MTKILPVCQHSGEEFFGINTLRTSFKKYLIGAFLLFSAIAFGQTTVFTDNFAGASSGDNTTTTGQNTLWVGDTNFTTPVSSYEAGGAIKLGTSSLIGSITSKSVNLSTDGGNVKVTFDVKGWTTVEGNIKVSITGQTSQTVSYTAVLAGAFETKTVLFTGGVAGSTVKIETTAKRAFIDNVKVETIVPGISSVGTGVIKNWSDGTAWVGGVAPSSSVNAIITGTDVINVDNTTIGTRNSGTTTTVNPGGTLATSVQYINNGTTTINGAFQLNAGGYTNSGNNFVYGATGTLNFNNTSSYGVNNTDQYWPTSSGPFNVTILQGGLTLNSGANRTVAGIFQTAAGVTLSSATLTLNGTAQINSGGFFNNSPNYGSTSTLIYNTGNTFGRGNEWTTATSGAGYPANVQVSIPGAFTAINMGSSAAQCSGNLTVDLSAILNTTSAGLTVLGNVTSNGTINLIGDVTTQGDWTIGASGLQLNGGKAVFFTKASGNQIITKTGGGTVFFDYFIINKAAGNVQLNTSPATSVVINTSTGGAGVLQLLNVGNLDLNGQSLTFNNDLGEIQVNAAGRTITSSVAGATLNITGNKFVTGAGTLNIGANVATILSKGLDFGSGKTTVNGILQINTNGYVNGNSPIYANTSTLVYNGVTNYGVGNEWTGNANTAGQGIPQNVNLIASSVNLPNAPRGLAGNLNIDSGSTLSLYGTTADLYIAGNWTNNKTFNANNAAVFFNGGAAQTLTGTTNFDYLIMNNNGGLTLQAASPVSVNKGITFTTGSIIIGANNITIPATFAITTGSAASHIVANSTGNLIRTGVGNTSRLFPVGFSPTKYSPITLTNTTGTSDLSVNLSTITNSVSDASKVVALQWNVNSSVATTATVSPTWESLDQGVSFANTGAGEIGNYQVGAYVIYTTTLNTTTTTAGAVSLVSGANPIVVGDAGAIFTSGVAYFKSNVTTGNWTTPGSWLYSTDNSTWNPSAIAPTSSALGINILNGNSITVSATGTSKTLTIDTGGILIVNAAFNIAGTTNVNGTWNQTTTSALTNTGTLNFKANSIYNHNTNSGKIPTASWDIASTVNITGMTSTQPTGGFAQVFGNFTWNCTGQTTSAVLDPTGTFNTKGLFTLQNSNGYAVEFDNTNAGKFYFLDGGLTISGGILVANFATSATTAVQNGIVVTGNTLISGTGKIDLVQGTGSGSSSFYAGILYLNGDLSVTSSTSYPITNTSSSNLALVLFQGNIDQNLSTTSATNSKYVDYQILNTSTLKLNSDFPIFSSSTLYDEFDIFGTLNLNGYTIKQSSGTQARFSTYSGSTLSTSNTGGLNAGITVGGTKTFAAGTNYIFNANTNTPFPTTVFGSPGSLSFNNANVISNSGSMTVSGDVKINGTSKYTLNPTGTNNLSLSGTMTIGANATFDNNGENQIKVSGGTGSININGTFITQDAQGFTGTNTAIPSITPTIGLNSTVVYGLNGAQAVTDFPYQNITFSGSGIKTSGTVGSIAGIITINSGVTLDAQNFTFGGTGTKLTMLGNSVFKTGGGITKPDATGTYTLDPLSTIEFQGSSATNIRISPTYENLTVSGTNITSGGKNFKVNSKIRVTSTGNLFIPDVIDSATPYVVTSSKGITVDAGGIFHLGNNANLIQDVSAVNSGNILVDRIAILPNNGYNYWSAPVSGQALTGNTFSPGTPDANIFRYNEVNDMFYPTGDTSFQTGKGYAIRGGSADNGTNPHTFNFTGVPNNGNLSTPVLGWTDSTHGYNLIGNPYPSNLDFNLFYTANSSSMYNNAYFWTNNSYTPNQQGSTYSGANYAIYNGTGGNPAAFQGSIASPTPTSSIKPGQAFIIQMKNAGSLSFDNSMRIPASGTFFNNKNADLGERDRFNLTLTTPSNINNIILIGYIPGATNDFERDFDAELLTETSDSFYSKLNTSKLAIQGKEYPLVNYDVVPLGAVYYETGIHKIRLTTREGIFNGSQDVYLKDNLLNQTVDLSTQDYTFSAVKGTDDSRFEIVYEPNSTLGLSTAVKSDLVVYRNNDNFTIKSGGDKISKVEVYDASGKLYKVLKPFSEQVEIESGDLPVGVYILKIMRNNVVISRKILKN